MLNDKINMSETFDGSFKNTTFTIKPLIDMMNELKNIMSVPNIMPTYQVLDYLLSDDSAYYLSREDKEAYLKKWAASIVDACAESADTKHETHPEYQGYGDKFDITVVDKESILNVKNFII